MELEALATSQQRSVGEHVECFRVKRPVRSLSGSIRSTGNFHEAIVEAQIVTKRILPPLSVGSVVGKSVGDVSEGGLRE